MLVVIALGSAVLAVPAHASAASRVATWSMNEAAGYGGTMTDSTGNTHGAIGSKVQRGVTAEGRKGYRWSAAGSDLAGQDRLINVGDRLDPGTANYTVSVTLRTGAGHQNVLQKGQSNTSGGFFKLDISRGVAYCTFKGSAGQRAVGSQKVVNDNAWHTVVCKRDGTGVSITTDGTTRRISGATGGISNASALTIGGKKYCNQTTVGCDYYVGLMDAVKITIG